MKRSRTLIILFILSLSNGVYHLIKKLAELPTIEEKVKNTVKNLISQTPDSIDLDKIPQWVLGGVQKSAVHYQNFGVTSHYIELTGYVLLVVGVLLMVMNKKVGFWCYILSQTIGIFAIFYGYGFNALTVLGAFIFALLAGLFIWLYRRKFWLLNSKN